MKLGNIPSAAAFLPPWFRSIKPSCRIKDCFNKNTMNRLRTVDRLSPKAVKELPTIHAPSIRSTKVQIRMSVKVEQPMRVTRLNPMEDKLGKSLMYWTISKAEQNRQGQPLKKFFNQSDRIRNYLINPQLFLDFSIQAIQRCCIGLMIGGIKYQKVGGSRYEMSMFESQELEIFLNDFSYRVNDSQ